MKENRIDPTLAHRPDIAILITRELDEIFAWDGDGPDPAEDGYDPYSVTVTAMTIRNGRIYEAHATLGGSYFKPSEPFAEIGGYYPDLRDEAIEDLDSQLATI